VTWPGAHNEYICLFQVYRLCVFEIWGYKLLISWPCCYVTVVAMLTILCALIVIDPCHSLSTNLVGPLTTEYWNFYVNTLRDVVTLTFEISTLKSCHMMPFGCSITIPSLRWIWLTIPELGRLQLSVDRQLRPNFLRFFQSKGVKFQISSFWTPKSTTLARTTYNDVLRVEVCSETRPVAPVKKQKRTDFGASNWLFAQTDYIDIAPWHFACRVVSGK